MSSFWRAAVLAVLIAIAVAVVAWATAPQKEIVPPTLVPVQGAVPSGLVAPDQPGTQTICGVSSCVAP